MLPSDSSNPTPGRAKTGGLALIYDGACGRCRNAIAWLDANTQGIEPLDLRDPELTRRFPGLSRERMLAQVHAIDENGRIFAGADAIREALARGHGWLRHLTGLWALPGFAMMAQLAYLLAARLRHRDTRHEGTWRGSSQDT
jgi:predicted DCC family thiol-disulfide oxidoreductase YuxK